MTVFNNSLYRLVSMPLQGIWEDDRSTFHFFVKEKPKKDQTPGNILDLILSIDGVEQGVATLRFTEEGVCYIHIENGRSYKIHAMYFDKNGNYCITLIESNGTHFNLQKREI